MDFQRIQIDGFGTLVDLQIDDLTSGLNVYYGANGSGKTTILHFLRGVICGFDEARRLELLPPIRGGIPGGSLSLSSDRSRFTVVRRGRPGETEALAIQVRQGSSEEAESLRHQIEGLDRDLVHLLYFVGSYEAHSLSGLVHLALRDGIDLSTTRTDAAWVDPLVADVEARRRLLWEGPGTNRLLGQRASDLDEADRIADNAAALQRTRQESIVEELRRTRMHLQRLEGEHNWLLAEVQPVETDLTECQTRLWSRRSYSVREVQQLAQPAKTNEAGWIRELHELDRQIEHAKQVLRDLAAARLRLTLESTSHACAETPDEATTLAFQRKLLTQLEQQSLQLQGECRAHREATSRGAFRCDSVVATFERHLSELRQTIYVLCQQIGRRESVLERQRWQREQARIAQCEDEVLERIHRLRLRREELISASRDPLSNQLRYAVAHEALHCRCEEHADYAAQLPSEVEQVTQPLREVVTERFVEESDARPGDAAWEKTLLARRTELRQRLFELQRRIRDARLRVDQLWAEQQKFADDGSVMDLQFARQLADERLAVTREQWSSLTLQKVLLTEARMRLHREEHSRVIAEASSYLNRLTHGRYTAFHFEGATRELFIRNAEGGLLPPAALSRGTLDQSALSLRLALVAEYARRGIRLPLVLDDVLVDSDELRLSSAVEVLREVAAAGQQIVFLTCQEHLSDLFDGHGLPVRTLGGGLRKSNRIATTRTAPAKIAPEVVAVRTTPLELIAVPPSPLPPVEVLDEPVRVWAAAPPEPAVSPLPRVVENASHGDPTLRVRVQPEGPYWLRVDSPVNLLPSLGSQMVARLGSLGIGNLGELIVYDLDSAGVEFRNAEISPAQLRFWQAEARLLTCVPDLTGPEAQLLAAIGIENPIELGAEEVEALDRRIMRARDRNSDSWQPWMADRTDWPDHERLRTWIRNGRRAMTLRAASQWAGWRPKRLHDLEAGDWDNWTSETRAKRDARDWDRDRTDREDRTSRRRPRTESLHLVSKSDDSDSSESSTPRFYLNPEDPVIDAPSIGPKMAERLAAIGILTVQDLFNRSPNWIADRLDDSKVDADTVASWQTQSSLMCQVPGLRGHDAMLLVACEITSPQQIISYSPDGLLSVVGPLVDSREGQRMLRSANPPDLAEVQDWINWSHLARTLRAA